MALNIVGWPQGELPDSWLHEILAGGSDKAAEAGIPIAGGHSIKDKEPKYGLVVSGKVHPAKIWRNDNPRPGDILILTKPIGTGILSTAFKSGKITAEEFEPVMSTMAILNRDAMVVARRYNISAATDITGYGLLGHLMEMLTPSHRVARIWSDQIPYLPKAYAQAAAGAVPGGSRANLAFVQDKCHFSDSLDEPSRLLLADAQTSGGLLLAIAPKQADQCLKELHDRGVSHCAIIGEIAKGTRPALYIAP